MTDLEIIVLVIDPQSEKATTYPAYRGKTDVAIIATVSDLLRLLRDPSLCVAAQLMRVMTEPESDRL